MSSTLLILLGLPDSERVRKEWLGGEVVGRAGDVLHLDRPPRMSSGHRKGYE